MIRRPPRSTQGVSSAASDVYKRQVSTQSTWVIGIDDEPNMEIMRLFNEKEGHTLLKKKGVSPEIIEKLSLFGISSIANIMGAIKMAKYYEMNENDCVFTVATDSMEMYGSRLKQQRELKGEFDEKLAAIAYEASLKSLNTEYTMELTCLLYTSPSPRDLSTSRMPSSA
eukprot:TRINITY_DN15192_c0_g1_i2.p1 TRINITY_DN15192_c0_g1~~TRINITY_DN15192_c0_g1_i2.p1  ORF type:complete len:169 (+),score=53.02 TRINITY_DN15192_c0_g1_i2:114-620(+)